jgi:uncharacterized membrane protein
MAKKYITKNAWKQGGLAWCLLQMCYGTISTFDTKMYVNVTKNNIANESLNLYDLEFIMWLHAIMPLLDCVHTLITFAQFHDMFIWSFIISTIIFILNSMTQLLKSWMPLWHSPITIYQRLNVEIT